MAPLPNQFTHWRKLRSSVECRVDCREGLGRHAARNDALNAVPSAEESIHILPSPVPVVVAAAVAGVVPTHRRAAGDRGCMTIPLSTFPVVHISHGYQCLNVNRLAALLPNSNPDPEPNPDMISSARFRVRVRVDKGGVFDGEASTGNDRIRATTALRRQSIQAR